MGVRKLVLSCGIFIDISPAIPFPSLCFCYLAEYQRVIIISIYHTLETGLFNLPHRSWKHTNDMYIRPRKKQLFRVGQAICEGSKR